MVLRGFRVVRVSRVLRVLWILRVLKVLRVLRVLGDLYGIPSNQGRSQRGAGGQCPHHESCLPPPPRQFSKLSISRRSDRENVTVFSHMAILISKVNSYPMCLLAFSLFSSTVLIVYSVRCTVCVCVQCTNSTSYTSIRVHIIRVRVRSICIP